MLFQFLEFEFKHFELASLQLELVVVIVETDLIGFEYFQEFPLYHL